MNNFDVISTRKKFPFFSHNPELIFLDNAASTQKLESMIKTEADFYTRAYAPVHRGIYTLAEEATTRYEAVRARLARWLNAQPYELVFTRSTTESINLVAQAWAFYNLHEGDEIVLTQLEHHANITPWLRLAQEKKIILKWIPVTSSGELADPTPYITERTKLLAITHASNALGTRIDVVPLIALAKKHGARVLVDAAQTAGRERLDVQASGCDFLAFSAHKMAGPTALGFLYIAQEVHKELRPWYVGGSAVFDVSYTHFSMRGMPHFLEAGTPPIAQVIAFDAVLEWLETVDFKALKNHEAQLCSMLIDALQTMPFVHILGPQEQLRKTGHLVSFVIQSMHAHDVAAYLNTKNICVRAGHHCAQPIHEKLQISASVRASFYAYTTKEEVEALCKALEIISL